MEQVKTMERNSSSLFEYFQALARLERGQPIMVSKSARICNDSVALEAGRKKGSIKKSRQSFAELIDAIDTAAELQLIMNADVQSAKRFEKLQQAYKKQRSQTDAAVASLVSRLYEIHLLKLKIKTLEDQLQNVTMGAAVGNVKPFSR